MNITEPCLNVVITVFGSHEWLMNDGSVNSANIYCSNACFETNWDICRSDRGENRLPWFYITNWDRGAVKVSILGTWELSI
jgi:hypothetical protein